MRNLSEETKMKISKSMKLLHEQRKKIESIDLAKPRRGRPSKKVKEIISSMAAKEDPLKVLEKDLLSSMGGMMASRERDLYRYISSEFNHFIKSQAFSDAVNLRLDFYGTKILEAECKRIINAIETRPPMSTLERFKAAIDILRGK